jgi:hypothetical protein
MKDDIQTLIKNMPTIMTYMTELNVLVNNLPKDTATDLTVTIGKSNFKLNKDKDKDLYFKFLETVSETSVQKIYKLRDMIDSLMYNGGDAAAAEKLG